MTEKPVTSDPLTGTYNIMSFFSQIYIFRLHIHVKNTKKLFL